MVDIVKCIGNTPLIRLSNSVTKCHANILVKLEEYNWGGSVKSRVAYQMILDAEQSGIIDKHSSNVTLIEATGGNTGIGIAQICSLRGYHCILVVPNNYSKVRISILKKLGADVILSDHLLGNDSHIKKVEEIKKSNPDLVHLNQFSNISNIKAHYSGTAQEIFQQLNGTIDGFVAGIGSGGTVTGIGRAIKERFPDAKIYGVQPKGCDVLNGKAIPHVIQGIAIGHIPTILDESLLNGIFDIKEQEIYEMETNLLKKSGLYLGKSSVANIVGAVKMSIKHPELRTIVTIAPDGGRNYIDNETI